LPVDWLELESESSMAESAKFGQAAVPPEL
jgi:hypothetical protein